MLKGIHNEREISRLAIPVPIHHMVQLAPCIMVRPTKQTNRRQMLREKGYDLLKKWTKISLNNQ